MSQTVEIQPQSKSALFDEIANRFLATRKSEATRKIYGHALRLYLATAREIETDPFKADALIEFNTRQQAGRRDNGGQLSNDTIRARLKAVQSFFSWCWAFDLSALKPELVGGLITLPPPRKLSPRDVLTSSEAAHLLDIAEPGRDHCLLRCMLDGGLRLAEVLALEVGNVYGAADRYYLHVAKAKGDKSRDVEIPANLYHELNEYVLGQGLDILDAGDAEKLIFGDLYPRAVQRLVNRLIKQAGITKRISPHSLRHTHAHHLRLAAWPLELIARRLGHNSLEVTKFYTRPAEMELQLPLPSMPWAGTEADEVANLAGNSG